MIRNITKILCLYGLVLLPVSTNAHASDEHVDTSGPIVRLDVEKKGAVSTFTLANGLKVVVIEDHRAPVVTQMIWYHAGSADEPAGRSGIAHFLEHLMFKGTTNHPGDEYSRFIARVGGEENAFTSYDYTAFYQQFAPQFLGKIMAYEADRMTNLKLTEDVVALERQVIIEERRTRTDNNPAAMLEEEAMATLFLNSPYHHPVIGWKQEMEQLSLDDALAFYHKYYQPNNATLVISGDVSLDVVEEQALQTFGKIASSGSTQSRSRPQEPVSRTLRTVTLRDPRISQPVVQKIWVVPSLRNGDKQKHEAEALTLLREALAGSQLSRLYQSFIVDTKIATAVHSQYVGEAFDDSVFVIAAAPSAKVDQSVITAKIDQLIADIAAHGIKQSELDDARSRIALNWLFTQDSATGLAEAYGSALSVGLTVDDVISLVDRLKQVTIDDIKAVAQKYLSADKGVTSYLMPQVATADDKPVK